MNIKVKAGGFLIFTALVLAGVSCKKILEVDPLDKVSKANTYNNVADADAAVIGVYGKFIQLAKPYILMNELRADLMDVTTNADPFLKQISSHTVTKDNPYINPKPYYEVILNCNDVLKNFNIMLRDKKISVSDYNMRYSDIGILRSWIYLQLGIHFGSIPYITDPVETIDDARNAAVYPKIPFNQLLDSLVNFTTKLPYVTEVYAYPTGSTLIPGTASGPTNVDNFSLRKIYITKPIMIGDIQLWKGNYLEAAKNYKLAMLLEQNHGNNIEKFSSGFRMGWRESSVDITVFYNRDAEESSLINSTTAGWRSIFALPNTNRSWNMEWYWALPYSTNFTPGNPFIELFSDQYGKYLLKPSKSAIDIWDSQLQKNGIPYDARKVLSFTQNTSTGNQVITKFTDNITSLGDFPIPRGGQWNIWRAGSVHLHYAEAANRDGMSKIAWAMLNIGLKDTFSPLAERTNPININDLNKMLISFPEPYFFDARDDSGASSSSAFRTLWYRNIGVRGRANMPSYPTSSQTNLIELENNLIEESARELAFEGQRWSDLLRIAMRRNDPSFLADKVYEKLVKAGDPNAASARAKLLAKDWYLPFNL